jgi:hypothetical protein
LTYESENRAGKGEVVSTDEQLAFAWVENARLAEISIVYEGATPGCGVMKATRDVEAGRMSPQIANRFAEAYRGLTVPGYQRLWPGHAEGEKSMSDQNKDQRSAPPVTAPAPAPEDSTPSEHRNNAPLNNPDAQTGGVSGTVIERAVVETALRDAGIETTDVRAGLAELIRLAADGRAYRADLIESALTEGVRIFGNSFDKPTYRAMFERSTLDEVKRVRDSWQAQSVPLFPAGRQTDDEVGKPEDKAPVARSNDERLNLAPKTIFGG